MYRFSSSVELDPTLRALIELRASQQIGRSRAADG
jgi:hypothetical protein